MKAMRIRFNKADVYKLYATNTCDNFVNIDKISILSTNDDIKIVARKCKIDYTWYGSIKNDKFVSQIVKGINKLISPEKRKVGRYKRSNSNG